MLFHRTKKLLLFFGFLLTISFSSCEHGIFESGISEGIIEYKIDYPDIPSDSYMLDLLPKKAETIFKNGEYRTDIIAGMGIFKTSIINDKNKKGLVHSIKILNKKLASELNQKDISAINPEFGNLEMEPSSNTKIIAGYECKEVKATVNTDSTWSFLLYYTKEIHINESNKMSPFRDLDGVLMEYHILSRDIHMRFIAEKVLKKEVKREDIILSEDYVIVSPKELKNEMDAIFNKLN